MSGILGASRIRGTLIALAIMGTTATLLVLSGYFQLVSANQTRLRLDKDSTAIKLEKMYDIREDRKDDAPGKLETFRSAAGKNAAEVADIRDGFVRGEESLKRKVPHLKIEYNNDIRIPEVISPRFDMNVIEFLTPPSKESNVDTLRGFLKENSLLVGVDGNEVDHLKVAADYTNPAGNISYVSLEQEFNDIPVFRGEVKAGFRQNGSIIRIINNLAPGVDGANLSMEFGDPTLALEIAARHVGFVLSIDELRRNEKLSSGRSVKYGAGDWSPVAEKIYFPTEPGVAVPAWRVLMWRSDAYYVIVDAASGTVLWHKNITDEQAQSATLQVYLNPLGYINVADSVMPLSPYVSAPINDPTANAQGTYLTRTNRTLVGNEGVYNFNNNGWITDDTNILDGNATQAGSDIDASNGIEAVEQGDTACPGAGCRVFTSAWNPQPGGPPPGDDPLGTGAGNIAARRGANIQMFYVMNLYHDELYRLGFTESARNFQHSNFGRGGNEADRISSEGQDQTVGPSCSATPCTDNANFSTPADGSRGRMQMYIWSGHTPRRDGTGDADIIIHEVTHGTSSRLHGNGSGLGNQGGMMGEGWGDFYAHSLLSQESDGVNGVYALSGYSTSGVGGLTGSYYYGIRRFPTAVISTTGGDARPGCNNQPCPHNPLTFKHVNTGCDTTLGTNSAVTSAFRRNPVFGSLASCSGVHNGGEIWKSALWEVRARMVSRLGFAAGTTRVLQAVTDGMKLSPISPTFLQGRDAIIAAVSSLPFAPEASADVADVREGFRVRGMGFSASVQSSTAVTEAFDFPNVQHIDPFSVSDSVGDNDGSPEPNENVLLSVPVTNASGGTITNVQVNIGGGPNVSYGTINDGQTVTQQIPYQIPAGAVCGAMHQLSVNVSSSVAAQPPVVRQFRVGTPAGGAPVTFSNNSVMNLPNGQPGTTSGPASPYSSDIAVAGVSGAKKITLTLITNNHTWGGDLDMLLEGPGGQKYVFMSDAFESNNQTGTVTTTMTIRDEAAAVMPATGVWPASGDFRPTQRTTGDAFVAPAPAPPYANAAPGGTDTFASVFGTNGSAMNGTWKLWVVDDASGDFGTMAGWSLTFESNEFVCNIPGANVSVGGRVVNAGGRGIAKAFVTATDGGNTFIVSTNSFGYFAFPGLSLGTQYSITPSRKGYTFTPQNVTPSGNITNLSFVGN